MKREEDENAQDGIVSEKHPSYVGNRNAAHDDVNLDVRIQVPMTEKFRDRVKALAESRGIKSAKLIRRLLSDELEKSGH